MNISTKGRYGLRAMLEMALQEREGPVSLSLIAQRQGLSERYLEQLMLLLKRAGLIKSVRGSQGGYLLAKRPEDMKVGDIIRALEGPVAPASCVNEECPENCIRENVCVTRQVWAKVRDAVSETLDSITLGDLVSKSMLQTASGQDKKETVTPGV